MGRDHGAGQIGLGMVMQLNLLNHDGQWTVDMEFGGRVDDGSDGGCS